MFLLIAYVFSWTLWIAGWVVADVTDAGDLLFNQDFVWRVGFVHDVPTALLIATAIAFPAVYGPMIGGIVASRMDPAIPRGSLRRRVTDVRVGGREYALVLAVLLGVTLPSLVITVATGTRSADAPSWGQPVGFLIVFFTLQFLTSGTEEIGWRGYLTEKLLPGRGFWDTGWLVGVVWALWHLLAVTMIFLQQGMGAPADRGLARGLRHGNRRDGDHAGWCCCGRGRPRPCSRPCCYGRCDLHPDPK